METSDRDNESAAGGLLLIVNVMMRQLLEISAIIEIATGIALLAVPGLFAQIVFGSALDTPTGLAIARIAGAALLSLGVACVRGSREAQSPARACIVVAMLTYNVTAAALLLALRYGAGMTSIGVLAVSALHTALAVWSIRCLRLTLGSGKR